MSPRKEQEWLVVGRTAARAWVGTFSLSLSLPFCSAQNQTLLCASLQSLLHKCKLIGVAVSKYISFFPFIMIGQKCFFFLFHLNCIYEMLSECLTLVRIFLHLEIVSFDSCLRLMWLMLFACLKYVYHTTDCLSNQTRRQRANGN